MEIIEINTKEQLDELYKDWSLTFEGVITSEAEKYRDYFIGWTQIDKTKPCYHISGRTMNQVYHLIGRNKYPDDLNIISFKLDTFKDVSKIAIVRFEIGGRWFKDIVDNNERRNQEMMNEQ